jgi:hypothetical protein
MTKRALLVGINQYPTSPLRGCLNDVEDWHKLITSVGGYTPENVRALCDERATTQGIKDRLAWLKEGAKPGDEVFFQFSGHGSQVRDRGVQDELADHMDEIICPVDLDWEQKVITDDDLADWIAGFPTGVRITVVLDSCHSGSGTRELRPPMENPHYKADRYIHPPLDIELRSRVTDGTKAPMKRARMGHGKKSGFVRKTRAVTGTRFLSWFFRPKPKPKLKPVVVAPAVPVTPGLNHLLISGCRSDQTSADAFIGGRYNGALTRFMVDAFSKAPAGIVSAVHSQAKQAMISAGYSQESQLEGPDSLLSRPLFG